MLNTRKSILFIQWGLPFWVMDTVFTLKIYILCLLILHVRNSQIWVMVKFFILICYNVVTRKNKCGREVWERGVGGGL